MRIVQILSHVMPTLPISARMVISCTVEYKQLTICTVYSGQLGPNPVHEQEMESFPDVELCAALPTATKMTTKVTKTTDDT